MSKTSHQSDQNQPSLCQPFVDGVLFLVVMCVLLTVGEGSVRANPKEELIPILGTTMGVSPVGEVVYRAASALGVSPDSWTVTLSFPYPGVTLYGQSCSAMIALSVVAMSKGEVIPPDRVLTGTVTPDGHIGTVGAVPLKVAAAYEAHLRRVLVPEE